MKRLIIIFILFCSFGSFGQIVKGYRVESRTELRLDTSYTTTGTEPKGSLYWDDTNKTSSMILMQGIELPLGEKNIIPVINKTSDTIYATRIVHPTGVSGGYHTIDYADSRYRDRCQTIGVVTTDIPPDSVGIVTKFGYFTNWNTTGYDTGADGFPILFLDTAGYCTTTIPTGGRYICSVGAIKNDNSVTVDINVTSITAEQQKYTGWPDQDGNSFPDNVMISLDSANRKVILTAYGNPTYYYYYLGDKYVHSTDTFQWSNVEGNHVIYFDDGHMTESVNPTTSEIDAILRDYVGVTHIYWSVSSQDYIYANNSFHTFDMNGKTKAAFYDIHKCVITDPITLTDFVVDGSGSSNTHAQFGNTSGSIRNTDIKTTIPAVVSTIGYPIFYRTGVNNWLSVDNAGFGVITTGTGRIAYNENVAGSYQLTEATNGSYVPYYFLVSNTLARKHGTVPGTNEYATADDAVAGAINDLSSFLNNLPEKEIATVGIVVYQTRDNYTNSVHGRIVSVTNPFTGESVDYIDLASPGITGGVGSTGMTTLIDDPNGQASYSGFGGSFITVNSTEDGWEFTPKDQVLLTDLDSTGFTLNLTQIIGLNDSLQAHRININELLDSMISYNTRLITLEANSHVAVTLVNTYDYLTLSGQELTTHQIDLTSDVTGLLPNGNIASATTWNNKVDSIYDANSETWISNLDTLPTVSTNTARIMTKVNHGLSPGKVIAYDSLGNITYALADSAIHADVFGIVVDSIDANTFSYMKSGDLYTNGTWIEGANYFLSTTSAGDLVTDQTYHNGNVYLWFATGTPDGLEINIDVGIIIDTTTSSSTALNTEFVVNETPSGLINGSNTSYTTASEFTANSTRVYLNQIRQILGLQYSESGTTGINFDVSYTPQTGDILRIDYNTSTVVISQTLVENETPIGTINGVNDTFTAANVFNTGTSQVYLNMVRQTLGVHYTEGSGTIVFDPSYIPQTGDILRIDYIY